MIILAILALICIFILLAKICDQYFVKSLDIIAHRLNLSEDVAGATFMALGTSAPEVFTAILALTKVGAEDIGSGTIVGSAIFNILVIIGASSVAATAYLRWKPVVRDMGIYIVAILLLLLTFSDGQVTTGETLLFLALYALYVLMLAKWKTWFPHKKEETVQEVMEHGFTKKATKKGAYRFKTWEKISKSIDKLLYIIFPDVEKKPHMYLTVFVLSIAFIVLFSYLLVELGSFTAYSLGVPPVIIALTILAGGTSIPDLVASLIVAKQGRGDMAVSNAVGSNSFDILIGLGLPWFFYTLITKNNVPVGTENLFSSVVLLFATVIAVFFVIAIQKFKIGKKAGYILVGIYALYLTYMITTALLPAM